MDFYESQKDSHGRLATYAWIGVGIFIFLTNPAAVFLSWQALAYFVVGMFAASVVFGWLGYGAQRALGKVLLLASRDAVVKYKYLVQMFGLILNLLEIVLIYYVARWIVGSLLF